MKPIHKFNIIAAFFSFSKLAMILTVPIFLQSFLESASAIAMGIALFGIFRTIAAFSCGIISDFLGKKKMLNISMFLSLIAQIGLFLSTSKFLIILFLICSGLSLGTFMSIRGPIITTISKMENRGSIFGIFSAVSDFVGIFGGLVVGYMVDYYSCRNVFLLIGVLSFLSLILSQTMTIDGERFAISKPKAKNILKTSFSGFSVLFLLMILINVIQTAVSSPLWEIVIPLYTSQIFEKASIITGILYSVDSLFSIAASLFFGKEADKRNPYVLGMFIAFAMAIISIIMPFFVNKFVYFAILYILFEIVFSGINPVLEKIESSTIREEHKGLDYALVRISLSVGPVIGSLVAGFVLSLKNGYGKFFFIVSGGYFIITTILMIMKGKSNKNESNTNWVPDNF